MNKKKSRKEKFEKYEKLAKKSIIYKPLAMLKLYRYSPLKRRENIEKCIKKYTSNINLTPKEIKDLKKDMAYCKVVHNIIFNEYFLYNFKNKSERKRKKFICNLNRQKYLYLLGKEEGQKTLRDKYKTYTILKKYYKRDIILINNEKDIDKLKTYIKKHKIFVKKPIDASFGKGIELIDSSAYKNINQLSKKILQDAPVIIEEQIISDEKMASLHPSSLNTVRIVTYKDDKNKVHIHLPFVKIGRGGSFVDNGGAGGMLAKVDPKTGILTTDGKDELNITYEYHPDTNVKIKGFKIPKWNEMIELAKKAALDFQDTQYIGWDVALSKDKGPVIIEGNGKTQFYGQQMCDEIGKMKDFEKLINYKKLKKDKKNIEYWELPAPSKLKKLGDEANAK